MIRCFFYLGLTLKTLSPTIFFSPFSSDCSFDFAVEFNLSLAEFFNYFRQFFEDFDEKNVLLN